MDEKFREDNQLRMTDDEAEAVIGRFREEEEAMRKEMEARATQPTVKDLAEGLNVPAARVAQLLENVRQEKLAKAAQGDVYTEESAKAEVHRQNKVALMIGGAIMLLVLVGFFAFLMLAPAQIDMSPGPSVAPAAETQAVPTTDAPVPEASTDE